ncbi:MAG: hypothetical protein ABIK09_08715 [Pseudomonadota bacterium]
MEHGDVVRQQGKVVCPNCGYILQVDASERSDPAADTVDGIKVEAASLDSAANASDLSEVIDWGAFSGDEDAAPGPFAADAGPAGTPIALHEDLTPPDGFSRELPPLIPEDSETEIGFDDPMADEKTPFEPVDTPAIMLNFEADNAPEGPIEWRLRTSSGLTFRFTDPDALLGWKKKINIYREMHVSPDGESWVDYVIFVKRFEACGDASRAFRMAGKTTEELEVPDIPPQSSTALRMARPEAQVDPEAEPEPSSNVPTTQFTFRTADKQGSRGKQILLLIVGLGLGAGAAWLALTYFGIIDL